MNYEKLINNREIVNRRFDELLKEDDFELNIAYLCKLHKSLFEDIIVGNGMIRSHNVKKAELMLDGETIEYSDYHGIETRLHIVFDHASDIDYSTLDVDKKIYNVAKLCAKLWEIHPFNEGNTRITALYTEKFLRHLGFDIDNTMFRENAIYFRNALVRANYYNYEINVLPDISFLIDFLRKVVLNEKFELNFDDIYIKELEESSNKPGKKRR